MGLRLTEALLSAGPFKRRQLLQFKLSQLLRWYVASSCGLAVDGYPSLLVFPLKLCFPCFAATQMPHMVTLRNICLPTHSCCVRRARLLYKVRLPHHGHYCSVTAHAWACIPSVAVGLYTKHILCCNVLPAVDTGRQHHRLDLLMPIAEQVGMGPSRIDMLRGARHIVSTPLGDKNKPAVWRTETG